MKKLLCVLCLILGACVTEKRVVNSQVTSPVMPLSNPSASEEGQGRPRGAAMEGRILAKGEARPRSLPGVRVGLFKKQGSKWLKVHEFSSEQDGTFAITRPVEKGEYELRSTDPRFKGSMPVNLDERALQGLLFEVSSTKK